jgi:hypothetical protein
MACAASQISRRGTNHSTSFYCDILDAQRRTAGGIIMVYAKARDFLDDTV